MLSLPEEPLTELAWRTPIWLVFRPDREVSARFC